MQRPDLMAVGDKSEMFAAVIELMDGNSNSASGKDLACMALRFVSQVCSQDNDSLVDLAIQRGVLFHYESLLADNRQNVVKEALWGLSNISAGTEHHLEAFLLHEHLLDKVLGFLSHAN